MSEWAEGCGEVVRSKLKIGFPSSPKRLAVSMSQAGYFLDGLTFVEKF